MKLRQSGITFIITVLLYSGVSILYKTAYGDNNESCFSSENFDIVRNYLAAEIKKDNAFCYTVKGCQLYIISESEIRLKECDYTLAVIYKHKGIYSLAKKEKNNMEITALTEKIFCGLLSAALK